MRSPAIELTATLTIEPAEMDKILDALAARVAGALPTPQEFRPPAPPHRGAANFLSAAQLAGRWQMHAESIRRMIRENRLPAVRIGRRLRISLAVVERLEGEGRTHRS